MSTSEPNDKRYWPWWWQVKEMIAVSIAVGVVTVETVRGTYNYVAIGLVLACLGVVAMTEYAKAILRRNGNGGGR